MAQEWYIDYGDRVEGPLTSRDLQTRASSGTLLSVHRVSPDRAKWVPASKIKGLTFADPPTSPPRMQRTAAPGQLEASSPGPAETLVHDPHQIASTAKASAAPPVAAKESETIPGYEILGMLGSGGMGVVYKARQLKLDRLVALKTIPVAAASTKMIARFEKEAVALAKLQHPNIVNVFDYGRAGESVFFAMEILSGQDLSQRIAKDGGLDERTVWAIARQTAAALAHAAAQGIYHRDIKPHNLFLVPMPTGFGYPPDLPMVKVTDFGLALTKRAAEADAADDRLTAAGTVLGTPAYMAPEQFKTPDVDHRADIYSLGGTVYHSLAGRPPFGGATVWDVMVSKINGEYPPLGPPVSQESNDLIAAMMNPDIESRVSSYEELIRRIDDLPAMRGVAGTTANVPMLPTRSKPAGQKASRRGIVLGAAIAGLLIFISVGSFALLNGFGPGVDTREYRPSGFEEALFDGSSAAGWVGMGGTALEIAEDLDTAKVLVVANAKRGHSPLPNRQVVMGVDLGESKGVEVGFAIPVKDPKTGPRLVIRVSRETGAVFGSRLGETGEFKPIGKPVPFPTAEQITNRGPYPEVKFGRAGGRWLASFNGEQLGIVTDDGAEKLEEFRVSTEGGPVRINLGVMQELKPVTQ